MYDILAERLASASEIVDAFVDLVNTLQIERDLTVLQEEIANTLYGFVGTLHHLLCTGVLGDDNCNDDMDAIYDEPDDAKAMREIVGEMRKKLICTVMDHFVLMNQNTQLLSGGRISLASLTLLCIAAFQRIETEMDPEAPQTSTFATDFWCTRKYAMIEAVEQKTTPVEDLSVEGLMKALFGIHKATPRTPYMKDMELYTRAVLRRALDLLMTPGDSKLWNIAAYREDIGDTRTYRFSALYLRDVTLMWHALLEYFDVAHLLPSTDDPHGVVPVSAQMVDAVRQWVLSNAVSETDVWARERLINLSMRAGEADLYHAAHPASHSTVHLILRDHRRSDYYLLTEQAPRPSNLVMRENAHKNTLHGSLVVLSTFGSRLKAAAKDLDPRAFVIMSSEIRQWSPYLRRLTVEPVLVMLFNHVQVWFNGQMLMYNNALEAVAAWMTIVDTHCDRKLRGYPLNSLLDSVLRPTETAQEHLERLAALNSVDVPQLGTGGVF